MKESKRTSKLKKNARVRFSKRDPIILSWLLSAHYDLFKSQRRLLLAYSLTIHYFQMILSFIIWLTWVQCEISMREIDYTECFWHECDFGQKREAKKHAHILMTTYSISYQLEDVNSLIDITELRWTHNKLNFESTLNDFPPVFPH